MAIELNASKETDRQFVQSYGAILGMAELLHQSEFILQLILNKWFYEKAVSRAQGKLRLAFIQCHLCVENPLMFYKIEGNVH